MRTGFQGDEVDLGADLLEALVNGHEKSPSFVLIISAALQGVDRLGGARYVPSQMPPSSKMNPATGPSPARTLRPSKVSGAIPGR